MRIVLVAASVPLLARLRLRTIERLLEPRRRAPVPPPETVARLAACVDLVLRSAHPIVRPGCLTRGLTLYHVLRRAGVDVRLCFGVGAVRDRFEAHCWLTLDDAPILEPTDPRPVFTPLYRMPACGT